MIAVVQRVSEASVAVDGRITGQIGAGLVALVAVEVGDGEEQIQWMAQKLVGLRIFRNEAKHFDLDVSQVGGGILLISNFTVAAETRKGRRPSLDGAEDPAKAQMIFERFAQAVRQSGAPVSTGEFGGDMRVALVNDGPATFILRSEPEHPEQN